MNRTQLLARYSAAAAAATIIAGLAAIPATARPDPGEPIAMLLVATSAAHAVEPPTDVSVNKAQVEYHERLQLAARTKAEIEHDERLLRRLIEKHAR